MAPRAAASPAWLGLFAAITFGGLVLAAFASGYHLVGRAVPRGAAVAPGGAVSAPAGSSERMLPAAEPSRAESAPAVAPAASEAAKSAGGAEPAAPEKPSPARKARGATAPQSATAPESATVRQHLPATRAVVHSKPEGHDRVAVLIGKQQVTVLARQGRWCRIEYRRFGRTITGWTDEANLTFP